MKVKVIKNFRDRETLIIVRRGNEAEYEPQRAKELHNAGFVEMLDTVEEEDVQAAEPVVVNTKIIGSDLVILVNKAIYDDVVIEEPSIPSSSDPKSEPDNNDLPAEGEKEEEEVEPEAEKREVNSFPEKSEGKKRGRKPKEK